MSRLEGEHAPSPTPDRSDTSVPSPAPGSPMLESMGGTEGFVYSTVPVVVFVMALALLSTKAAVIAAIATGVVLTVTRLMRGERLLAASGSLTGVLIAAGIVALTGSAKDFFLLGIWVAFAGFLATFTWAITTTFDRLVFTFDILGLSPRLLLFILAILYVAAAALHLSGVLHAHALGYSASERRGPHPMLAGIASLLVPGWGQVLNSHRRRSALFLGSLWVLGAAWIAVSPLGSWTLSRAGLRVPASLLDGWGPSTLVTLTAVLWVVAVYDAAAGAAARRGRSFI